MTESDVQTERVYDVVKTKHLPSTNIKYNYIDLVELLID